MLAYGVEMDVLFVNLFVIVLTVAFLLRAWFEDWTKRRKQKKRMMQ